MKGNVVVFFAFFSRTFSQALSRRQKRVESVELQRRGKIRFSFSLLLVYVLRAFEGETTTSFFFVLAWEISSRLRVKVHLERKPLK